MASWIGFDCAEPTSDRQGQFHSCDLLRYNRNMDWTRYRSEMPITKRWAFFDHAAVAPITARAQKAISEWTADMAENGDVMEHRWVQRIEEVRRLAGRLLIVLMLLPPVFSGLETCQAGLPRASRRR